MPLGELFTAGESAPNPVDANAGELIINKFGNIAISGFAVDLTDQNSSIRLDTSVDPPVLHLSHAVAVTHFGYTDANGEFVSSNGEQGLENHIVTGTYSGPGSELELH